jgi:hypothetical protein
MSGLCLHAAVYFFPPESVILLRRCRLGDCAFGPLDFGPAASLEGGEVPGGMSADPAGGGSGGMSADSAACSSGGGAGLGSRGVSADPAACGSGGAAGWGSGGAAPAGCPVARRFVRALSAGPAAPRFGEGREARLRVGAAVGLARGTSAAGAESVSGSAAGAEVSSALSGGF